MELHYVCRNAKFEYLPAELSISEMYRMYLEWTVEKSYLLENYHFYSRVFHERLNLKFQRLKKDMCDTCETFKNANEANVTAEEKLAQQDHLNDKNLVREIKDVAKVQAGIDKEMVAAAFDLQKVLLTPYGQTSSFHYSRSLKNYNFMVTEIQNMSTSCYFWSESECNKGSCEVATALKSYLVKRRSEGIKHFHLFSDRHGGQDNNRMIFVMLLDVLNNFDIDSITLTYLLSGHSKSENGNAHSLIEQMARKKTIYSPVEWESVIQCAFKKNP